MKKECSFQAAPGRAPLPFSHGYFHPGGEIALNKIAKLSEKPVWDHLHPVLGGIEGNAELLPMVCIPGKRDGGHRARKHRENEGELKCN